MYPEKEEDLGCIGCPVQEVDGYRVCSVVSVRVCQLAVSVIWHASPRYDYDRPFEAVVWNNT
jgi:hypothetical protein